MPAASSDLSLLSPPVQHAVATLTLVLQQKLGTATSPGAHPANSLLVFPGRDTLSKHCTLRKESICRWLYKLDLMRFNLQVLCLRLFWFDVGGNGEGNLLKCKRKEPDNSEQSQQII